MEMTERIVWVTGKHRDHAFTVLIDYGDGRLFASSRTTGESRVLLPGMWRTPQQQTDKLFASQ